MKNAILFIVSAFIVSTMFIACEDDKNEENNSVETTAKVLSYGQCKNGLKDGDPNNTSEACIEYSYNSSTNNLLVTHINVGFNCCPEKINATFTFSGDTIIITESEIDGECDCLCLYDINMQIPNLEQKLWYIKVEEENLNPNNDILYGYLNLENTNDGKFCVTRSGYPWGL